MDNSTKLNANPNRSKFVPQAKRRQNAQRLKQLNARRKGNENDVTLSQHGRTRNAGRGGNSMQGRGGRGGRGGGYQWRDRIDRQASGECAVRKSVPSESVVFLVVGCLLFIGYP